MTAPQLLLVPLLIGSCFAQILRLHPANSHYFEFRGKPVLLVTSGEHYGSVLNRDFDFRRYLDAIAADGLNFTRVFTGTYREVPGTSFGIPRNTLAPEPNAYLAPWARSSERGYAGGGNKFDLGRWDAAYFERLAAFVSEAAKRGIIVEVTMFSSHYQEQHWKLSPFNPANNVNGTAAIEWHRLHTLENGNILARQEQTTRKIVRELNPFDNVMFEIQNEPWSDRTVTVDVINPYLPEPARDKFPNAVDVADAASLAWQSRVGEWIRNEESHLPKRHLIAQNFANFRASLPAVDPNVSVLNFHYAYPEAVSWNSRWARPVSYDETGFIGRSDDTYRREAWRFLMAGGAAFDGLDYSFTAGHEDGTDLEKNGPGGGSPSLRRQLGILRSFLSGFDFAHMKPDAGFVRGAPGLVCQALSKVGEEYAVYCNGNGPAALDLDLPAGSWAIEIIDTRTGRKQSLPAAAHITLPEFQGDAAIAVRRSGK
jgi:hypothetical protein